MENLIDKKRLCHWGWAWILGVAPSLFAHEGHEPAKAQAIESAQSGAWSSPKTWKGGQVPGAGAQVLIRKGHRLIYDVDSKAVIRGIQISGILTFATNRNTRLDVGLIRIEDLDHYCEEGFDCQAGAPLDSKPTGNNLTSPVQRPALEIGRAEAPLPAEYIALIRLHYLEGMDKESCPAIICCGGRMDLHGAPLERTWVKLPYQTAKVGEAKIVMPNPLPGWKVDDRIILTGTTRQFGYIGTRRVRGGEDNSVADNPTTEERIITGMRPWGEFDSRLQIVSLDKPLQFDHLGSGEYRAEVANLSRNVVVESADSEGVRGHTMYHIDSQGSISYAEFRHLGKRDTLGKYPIHYHLAGETMRGSSLIGVSVWDSHNRFFTVHGTQYLVVKDCIGYKGVGHGYFLEDGTEVYNIFDRNLAVQALGGKPLPKQVLPYDGNLGSGFWWANSLNTFTRNVAAECDEDGFRYEAVERKDFNPVLPILQKDGTTKDVDIRTLPFVRFDGNEAHCQRLFAINLGGFAGGKFAAADSDVEGVGPDYQHPFVLRNTKVWNSHWAFHCGTPCTLIEDFAMHDCAYGLWRCVMHRHEHRRMTFSEVNTPVFFPRAAGDANYDYSIQDYFDLEPKDDLPPVTVITRITPVAPDLIRVTGVTSDNYDVKRVLVNNRPVSATAENYGEWEIDLPLQKTLKTKITAFAEDKQGNAEFMPHVVHFVPRNSLTPDGNSHPLRDVSIME